MERTLPPTDTRRRPDQRLMEQADFDRGAEEKHRLEEKQRAARKQLEVLGVHHHPRYFRETIDSVNGESCYEFNNTYWQKRKALDYADMPDLY